MEQLVTYIKPISYIVHLICIALAASGDSARQVFFLSDRERVVVQSLIPLEDAVIPSEDEMHWSILYFMWAFFVLKKFEVWSFQRDPFSTGEIEFKQINR